MNLRGRDPRLQGAIVSAEFFEMLRARPLLGRVFTAADEAPGAAPVILLSYDTWRRHFGGDPADRRSERSTFDSVLGPRVSGPTTRSIGVMPESFQFPRRRDTGVDDPPQLRSQAAAAFPAAAMLARLADGVSLAAAAVRDPAAHSADSRGYRDNDGRQLRARSRAAGAGEAGQAGALVLTVAVGFVLLLACVNVANLLLARTAARQREIRRFAAPLAPAVDGSIRYLLTESVTLGLCWRTCRHAARLWRGRGCCGRSRRR